MVLSYNLNSFLSGHVFVFLMLLARVGSVMMLMPGIGAAYVPPRSRMAFACALCLLLVEPMMGRFPPLPAAPAELARLVVYEMVIGFFFGSLIRLMSSSLEATGFIIGAQTGLSNATMLNPALATQSPLPSAFLTTAALALMFITGLDHFLIRSTIGLYDIFPAGGPFMPGDMAQTFINITNQTFVVGIELSAPFLITGLLLYASIGILQRLMPSVQLFMITMPLEIWGGLLMLSLTMAGILTIWLHYFDESVGSFFQK